MKITILTLFLSLFTAQLSLAQSINRAGTSAAQFLKFGVGARASALGEAGVTLADDVSGLYWNPAGITRMTEPAFMVSRNQLYADISYSFFGLTYPIAQNQALGLSAIFLDSGEMEVTTLESPQGTGRYFNWESLCIAVTYSRFMTDRLSLGVSVKYIREGAYNSKAHTTAVDFGSLLNTGVMGLKLGMSLSNLGPKMQLTGSSLSVNHEWYSLPEAPIYSEAFLGTDEWSLPLIFRLGLSTELVGTDGQLLTNKNHRVILAADTFDPNDALVRSNFGLEYEWYKTLALRAGYRGVSLEKDTYDTYISSSYTLGLGFNHKFKFGDIKIDYAFTDYDILGSGHQVSFMMGF